MNILILNWRDPKNKKSGGAEKITQKYAEYWANEGHKVIWLSNSFNKSKKYEVVNKVIYYRVKPELSNRPFVNIFKYLIYISNTIFKSIQIINKEKINLVVDEIHGIPFLTPLYVPTRKVLLTCEVAGPIWNKMFSFPINKIGILLEKLIYKVIYRNTEIWAISNSTKRDILLINNKLNIKILPIGIDLPIIIKNNQKFSYPSAVFLARLVKMKGIETAIMSAYKISKKVEGFKLYILGNGTPDYESKLRDMVKKYNLDSVVEFLGYVDESTKYTFLSKCHFLLHTSYKEGFGLTVLEAGIVGTPSIVRSGSSLDELIEDGVNGFTFTDENLISDIFSSNFNSKNYNALSNNSRKIATKYLWKNILSISKNMTQI